MTSVRYFPRFLIASVVILSPALARADESFATVAEQVNRKVVKLFGSGGIRGLPSYGSGILVSSDGYILTVYNHILETEDLRVHLWNNLLYHAKVVAIEPELDVALVKIVDKDLNLKDYFDVAEAAKRPMAEPGTGILGFSNQFLIATRGEPMSIQRGRVAAVAKLQASRGIFQAPFSGDVYVIDAITNNPGAAGGAVTTRKGELLGLIGKELRNDLSNTWINYAVPINAKIEVREKNDNVATRTIAELVEKKDKYVALDSKRDKNAGGGYTGMQMVANVLELTPPYIEEVAPGSPAAKAGLKPDDLIVYVDGLPVNNIQALEEMLNQYRPGQEIRLEVQRAKKLTTVTIKLEEHKTKKKPVKPGDDKDK